MQGCAFIQNCMFSSSELPTYVLERSNIDVRKRVAVFIFVGSQK